MELRGNIKIDARPRILGELGEKMRSDLAEGFER